MGSAWLRSLLRSAVVLALAGGGKSVTFALETCSTTSATPFRVHNATDADTLRTMVDCVDGGTVEVVWEGAITLDTPITIGSGTFLSVTGEDETAEVQGGSQTRMFEVLPSGGLELTQLKLTGGSASSGGAIHSSLATVTLKSCVFKGNVASSGDGGAVWAEGGELTILEGAFSGNSAAENGGAVSVVDDGLLVIQEGVRFGENYARLSGGALYGGSNSVMTIDNCTFENNLALESGGGIAASSATLGGATLLTSNSAQQSGGGVVGWDSTGAIEFNGAICSENSAVFRGGCFYGTGKGVIANGTTMESNEGGSGGAICVGGGGEVDIFGGDFTTNWATVSGGFVFAADGAILTIKDGTVSNNIAERRAGAVYCAGESSGLGGAKVTIEGGTFSSNHALELGGAVTAWGALTVVVITGGVFRDNTAKFFGGFIFLEEGASLSCRDAQVQGNSAGDQGGGIYARDATWVNSTCDLINNAAPQGPAAYLTYVSSALFENHKIVDGSESGMGVVFATETSIVARGVDFRSELTASEDSSNRAVQLEGATTLVGDDCVFGGWTGDTVIYHANPEAGSLVLNSCDFTASSAVMMIKSLNSDAEVRNALVGDLTIENAAVLSNSPVLVDRVLTCDNPSACGPGECVDSVLGVLCECLEDDACLGDGGGALSIDVKTAPPVVTYSPDLVYFELMVSASADGTTPVIWKLAGEADDFDLQPLLPSGILPPGGNVTVAVTGSPQKEELGGTLISRFVVTSVDSDNPDAISSAEIEVASAFFFCRAFEYAVPTGDGTVACEQCVTFDGFEGLDCEEPGATLASMPVREGYWRSSRESLVIHQCLHPEACTGGTQVSSSDNYCQDGYEGPYCAVCSPDYGPGADNACHSCTDAKSRWLIFAGSVLILAVMVVILVTVVFLIGGLDALEQVKRSVYEAAGTVLPKYEHEVRESSKPERELYTKTNPGGPGADSSGPTPGGGSEAEEAWIPRNTTDSPDVPPKSLLRFPDGTAGKNTAVSASAAGSGNVVSASAAGSGNVRCCGLRDKVKHWASRVPLNKVKILVVVWQVLTAFPSISGVSFPSNYSKFLSWIDAVNFDVGSIFSASCIIPAVGFYQRLLLATLAPLGLGGVLVVTYRMATRRAGIGSASILRTKAAWSRHLTVGLLLTFLVFTSTSTIVFKTFACDEGVVEGESFLRADYGIPCNTVEHTWYKAYAGIMIVVYPIGIPLLYAFILWVNRDSLNPRERAGSSDTGKDGSVPKKEAEDVQDRLERRRQNPDLVPSMFLWKDFGPNMYYYEVIDCGRRILLTGALIFIAPNTAAQAAVACMFAFASLLGFELLRPHLDPLDSWLYRLGCVVIFLSNFLALLIKADTTGEGGQSLLGGLMVAINVLLILAVLFASWLATQQTVQDHREGESAAAIAGTMLTFERRIAASARFSRQQTTARLMRGPKKVRPSPSVSPDGNMNVSTVFNPATAVLGDMPVERVDSINSSVFAN